MSGVMVNGLCVNGRDESMRVNIYLIREKFYVDMKYGFQLLCL